MATSQIRTIKITENQKSVFAVDIEVSGFHLQGDEPDAPETPGGKNLAPSPYDYLTVALGECTVMTTRWYAQRQNWQVEKISATITHQKIDGKDVFEKTISIVAPNLSEQQIKRLVDVAAKCPVHKTLTSDRIYLIILMKNQKNAFSLVELSVVILIVAILITGSLGISKTAINSAKLKITQDRMDTVYRSISNFVAVNRRLPCPAKLDVAKGDTIYGNESDTPGTCTDTFKSSTNAPNLAWGAVPVKALGLDDNMAEDGFGTKFSYVVDRRFTKQSVGISATDGFEIVKSIPNEDDLDEPDASTNPVDLGGISPQSPSGTNTLANKNGVLLLISHGSNKFKGFNSFGISQNSESGIADENNNGCDEDGGTCSDSANFDREFVANSTNPNFDDVVLFKTKSQIVKDAELEFMMCNASEAKTSSQTWLVNANYGENAYSSSGDYFKTCGKYGVWGAATPVSTSKPLFSGYKPGTSDITGLSGDSNFLDSLTEEIDTVGSLNSTSGIFIAPIPGLYLFNYSITFTNISLPILTLSGNLTTFLVVNSTDIAGQTIGLNIITGILLGGQRTVNQSQTIYLEKGDQVKVRFGISTGTFGIKVANRAASFSGMLISN